MRALIDNGYVYIAQPPLYRVKRGRTETYIKDDRELEAWLIRRAVEARIVRFPGRGLEASGAELERLLHRLIAFQRYLHLIERRCPERRVIMALLDRDARDRAFFTDRAALDQLAESLTDASQLVTVQPDEEHNAHALAIEHRGNGYARHHMVGVELISTGEYRTLLSIYRDVKGLEGEILVSMDARKGADEVTDDLPTAAVDATTFGGGPVDQATKMAAEPRRVAPGPEQEVRLASLEALTDYFVTAGKKGVAINRYKGLGEMNPEQLWATTMKPDVRTLLQVRAEDHAEADQMFTTLMGDQVEPRRKFIEDNALDVKNLDV